MNWRHSRLGVAAAAIAAAFFSNATHALAQPIGTSIGVHFPSNRGNPASRLLPTEVAGLPGFEKGFWNSADGGLDNDEVPGPTHNRFGTTANISLPVPGVLTDSQGLPTATTVEWTSNGTWNTTNGTATPDAKLMNGYIDAFENGDLPGVTAEVVIGLHNIPYTAYDVVVYVGSDGNNRLAQLSDGTTTYYYTTQSNDPNGGGGFDPGTDYIPIFATDPADRAPGNVALFSGHTEPDLEVRIIGWSAGNNNGIHAIQIVNLIPEPSTIVLLGIGAAGLLVVQWGRRRR
jgi:hypothetical protein